MNTVENTVNCNLCISCGICKAVCPKNCISYERKAGLYVPVVNESECVHCGRCYQVCPGKGFDYSKADSLDSESLFWTGEYQQVYCAAALNEKRRENAVSGGVVTELVFNLLQDEEYDVAFLIQFHQYQNRMVETDCVLKGTTLENTQKSRYLPVSQEKAVSYMLANKDAKIILVGTSCFVQGILNVIDAYRLNRNNFFIIGLFCDRTMSLDIVDYFSKHPSLKGKTLDRLYFRSKEVNGWPGGVKMETTDGDAIKLPNTERMKVKDYFHPERCLYCLDKLNRYADISVGDNYTKENADKKGSNSVIVRTKEGQRIWEKYAGKFECQVSSIEKIKKSQHLDKRKENYCYARMKEHEIGQVINRTENILDNKKISLKIKIHYFIRKIKLRVGLQYGKKPWLLHLFLLWKNCKLSIRKLLKRS